MSAGQLRESVTFQRRAAGSDGRGNTTTGAWTNITGCIAIPAQIKPLKAGETVIAEGVQGRRLYQVLVRRASALDGVNVGDKMLDARDGRTFNVKAPPINPDMHDKYLQILVEQGGADG